MSNEQRKNLLKEIEEIRTNIERLQPEAYEEQVSREAGLESSRAKLKTLRKELARDMELLHADCGD